jgi:hypothetical protein
MRKACENGLIFVKFHKIWFREIFFSAKNFASNLRNFVKTENFAKVVAKTKNRKEFDSDPACMVYVVSLFLYNITFFEDKNNKVVM